MFSVPLKIKLSHYSAIERTGVYAGLRVGFVLVC